ncbi:MAG: hypothetical protein IJ906_05855 [Oscillospiraceae bacterium]|nr:hypothetical protein [Oscillospiraceae bacterium]
MKCPYCNEEMSKGVLGSTGGAAPAWVYWITESYEKSHPYPPSSLKSFMEAKAVQIKAGFGLRHKADPFWLCRKCGRLIGEIQLPENGQS